jgi:hypothetical protein
VLGRNQLEHGVAQVFQALVVGGAAFRMLVVVGAMGQRLPEQRNVMKSDAERSLEFLERLVSLSDFGLRW